MKITRLDVSSSHQISGQRNNCTFWKALSDWTVSSVAMFAVRSEVVEGANGGCRRLLMAVQDFEMFA